MAMLLSDEPRRSRRGPRGDPGLRHRHRRARRSPSARAGFYPEGDRRRRAAEPPAQLRSRASRAATASARSCASSVLFALHNVLRDPPFSRLDLISCRNLLIYLDRDVRSSRCSRCSTSRCGPAATCSSAASETVDAAPRLFTPVDKKHRIYRANPVGRPLRALPAVPTLIAGAGAARRPAAPAAVGRRGRRRLADLHRQLLEQYAPPSVLVDRRATSIVHLVGRRPLPARRRRRAVAQPAAARCRPELRLELRTALFQALQLQAARRGAPRAAASATARRRS